MLVSRGPSRTIVPVLTCLVGEVSTVIEVMSVADSSVVCVHCLSKLIWHSVAALVHPTLTVLWLSVECERTEHADLR
jgi:hypothetical protein